MAGRVELHALREMLAHCAPGHVWKESGHRYYQVYWEGRSFRTIPRGPHRDRGDRKWRAEIAIGIVENLIEALEIDWDKAKEYIPQLRGRARPGTEDPDTA